MMTNTRYVETNHGWLAFSSSKWGSFHLVALVATALSLGLIIYGATAVSEIWMLAPLLGIIFIPLSVIARTWGWIVIFALIFLFFPLAILFQGVNW